MKHITLTWTFICFSLLAVAQTDAFTTAFNQDRLQKQKTGMLVLGTWALGNITTGLVLAGKSNGSRKSFHQMNAGWNLINLGIAGLGYFSALSADPAQYDLYQTIQEQNKIQKILLFNAGLDLGYMAAGAYLIERSRRGGSKADQWKGFGRSLILQGGFLFVFDLANNWVHARNNSKLEPILSSLYFDGQSIGMVIPF